MIKSNILMIILGLALAACGSSKENGRTIDVTTGESLQASLKAMSEGMTEEKKAVFTRDLNTIFESILVTGAVDQKHLFSDDTAWILDEVDDPIRKAKFTRIVQKGRSKLEGLSAKGTAALATEARSHWFSVTGNRIVSAQKDAEREWNKYPSQILKLSENYERISSRVSIANERHEKAFKNYEVSDVVIGKDLRLAAKGSFEATNIFDKPATRINYMHRFGIANIQGHTVNIDVIVDLKDQPLQPGETRTISSNISSPAITVIRRDRDADVVPLNDMVGTHQTVRLDGYLKGFLFKGKFQDDFEAVGANLKDQNYLGNYDDLLALCLANKAAAQKYYEDLGNLIPLIKELKEKPRAVSIEFPENTSKKGPDGYYCNITAPS